MKPLIVKVTCNDTRVRLISAFGYYPCFRDGSDWLCYKKRCTQTLDTG